MYKYILLLPSPWFWTVQNGEFLCDDDFDDDDDNGNSNSKDDNWKDNQNKDDHIKDSHKKRISKLKLSRRRSLPRSPKKAPPCSLSLTPATGLVSQC